MTSETVTTGDGHRISLLNLLDTRANRLYNIQHDEAVKTLKSLSPERVNQLDGEFALAAVTFDEHDRHVVVGARTLGVPARVACQLLSSVETRFIFAHTIREIREMWTQDLPQAVKPRDLKRFDTSYTEMLPAFYLVRMKPWAMRDRTYEWFLDTPEHKRLAPSDMLPSDPRAVGTRIVRAAREEVRKAVLLIPEGKEIGVPFSGGVDSGTVVCLLINAVENLGRDHRLRFFTLAIDEGGSDLAHAEQFISALPERYRVCWEPIRIPSATLDAEALRCEACSIAEEYHIRDLECAMAGLTLLREVRQRYPDLRYLFDGDGGNEAFEDYPLEDEGYGRITIDDVWRDPHLFYLGYERQKLAFNPVFSGGLSRAYVRTFNPARHLGFIGCSPFISRPVLKTAQQIPLKELAPAPETLHTLRGRAMAAGLEEVLGISIPVFEKVRFQEGAMPEHRGDHTPRSEVFRITEEQSTTCKNALLRSAPSSFG